MRVLIRIAIFFYVFLIMMIGFSGLILLTRRTELAPYEDFLRYVYQDPGAGMIAGFVIAGLMLVSLMLARIIYYRQQRERVVSIDNPKGPVTISLNALEDIVRRMGAAIPQVKELRPVIVSSRRGLKVDVRMSLNWGTNIPSLTTSLQEKIASRIQDVLGKEDHPVSVRIHVTKIMMDLRSKPDAEEDSVANPVHFHGYRA